MSLSPKLCADVVELKSSYTGTCHRQICDVKDISSFSVEVLCTKISKTFHLSSGLTYLFAISETKDLEDTVIWDQSHSHAFSTAFFVAGTHATEDRTPGFAGLVVRSDRLLCNRRDWRVLVIKVVHSR